jgi:ATP-GRASP peptide maturase of grasp-with-spasm system
MILIFSESNDSTTSIVMEWLLQAGHEVLRLNECDKLLNFSLSKQNITLDFYQLSTKKNITLNLDAVKTVWYRKGNFRPDEWFEQQLGNKFTDGYLKSELRIVLDYLYYILGTKRNLAVIFTSRMNKLHVNQLAVSLGLETPDFLVSTEKNKLNDFLAQYPKGCITKAISETFYIAHDDTFIISYTEAAKADDLKDYPERMKPVLLQNKVDKKYELRIFYLNGVCYSSAIFSQNDEQTKVDFRKYNYEKPNRTVPFNLPPDIADKIDRLMKQLNLKTGSIDMLVTKNNRYIFLEINPVGQFGMVSDPCNYYLEKKVAEYLMAEG